ADSQMPMAHRYNNSYFSIEGRPEWPGQTGPLLQHHSVTAGYFRALGIPILRGREFTDADMSDGRPVMIVNQTMAARFFPNEDPLGHRINAGEEDGDGKRVWREIIGVAADVREGGLATAPLYDGFAPHAQTAERGMMIAARTPLPATLLQ